jgi:hypothetical protein
MKAERGALLVAIVALITAGWCACEVRRLQTRLENLSGELRSLRPNAGSPSLLTTNLDQRVKTLEAASPGLGGIMADAQTHFAKLYFASEARNWDLARFEWGELESKLNAIAALRAEERGVGLSAIVDAFKQTQLVTLKDAIELKDRRLFREAYQESISMCNGCHQATGRPFIAITTPTQPPVSNQRWEPPSP